MPGALAGATRASGDNAEVTAFSAIGEVAEALAARWLQRRYGLDVRRALLIAALAGLGGRGL